MEHLLRVSDRRITAPAPRWVVQNGIKSDEIRLELDAEYEALSGLVLIASKGGTTTRLPVTGETVTIPSALMAKPGPIAFSLVGYDGERRVITREMQPSECVFVVPSGPYDGSDPAPDEPDLLGQLTQAAQAAREAAAVASAAASGLSEAVSSAQASATAAAKSAEDAKAAAEQATSGAGLPTTGGTLTGNLTIDTGTTEPNVTVMRTVDGAQHAGILRIDSDGVLGVRHTVNGSTVNNLYLERSKTRFTRPLDPASGGVPTGGTAGQILRMGASAPEWADEVTARALEVVDDPAAPTSGIVMETTEEGKTSIHGIGELAVDEVHVADIEDLAADASLAVSAGTLSAQLEAILAFTRAIPAIIQRAGLEDVNSLEFVDVYPEWHEGRQYRTGDVIRWDGALYKVQADHVGQTEPQSDATNYKPVTVSASAFEEWVQPVGGHDAYHKGHIVTDTTDGRAYHSLIDGNVWGPPSKQPQFWELHTEGVI